MKNTNQPDQIKALEAKIDRLQRSITKLEKKDIAVSRSPRGEGEKKTTVKYSKP